MTTNRSVWLATATMPQYEAIDRDLQGDVLVVGGGIIGLTTALYLQQEGLDVVLLEASRIAARTSGNTTGKVTSQHGALYASLVDRHGREKAEQYASANQGAIDQIASLSNRLGIECELTRGPSFVYSAGNLQREADVAWDLGLPAQLVAVDEIGLPGEGTSAVRFDAQVMLHPARYLAGLADAFVKAGGRIFEQSRVTEVNPTDDGVDAKTALGPRVAAAHGVVATLLPIGTLGGYFARTRPNQSHGIAVRLPVEAPLGMTISADEPLRSTRPWPGGGPNGLIVVGGGHETGAEEDTGTAYQDLLDWVNFLWDTKLQPDYRWSAEDYSTPDLLPYVGKATASPVLIATGMNKWGLTNGTVAAGILRDAILDRDNPWSKLYDAGRIGDAHAVAELVKDNLKVGKEFAIGRLHTGVPTCTHLGCPLHWNQADSTWDCNCHGSRFTPDGSVLDGPATTPLTKPNE